MPMRRPVERFLVISAISDAKRIENVSTLLCIFRNVEKADETAVVNGSAAIDEGIPFGKPGVVTVDPVAVVVVEAELEAGVVEA